MEKLLKKLFFGTPIKGEKLEKPKFITIKPDEQLGFNDTFLNIKKQLYGNISRN